MDDRYTSQQFASLARSIALSGGSALAAARAAETYDPDQRAVVDVLKAAVAGGELSDPAWAGSLSSYRLIVDSFVSSLRNFSAFDRMLADMRQVPLRTLVGSVTVGANGAEVGEGEPAPISRLSLTRGQLEARKAIAIAVLSEELLRAGSTSADSLLKRELQLAVSAATNRIFIGGITAGAPSFASAGSSAANVLADIEALLDSVSPTAASRLYLIVDGSTAGKLATKAGTDGHQAFPGMTPQGGEIAGIPVLVADDVAGDTSGPQVALIDAAAVAAGHDTITLDEASHASLQLDDAPASGEQELTSLWQTNSKAIRATRWFGFELLRSNGVAVLTGASY